MKPLAVGFIFAMAAVAGGTGQAAEQGKADGRMSVNGKVVKLSHAYARADPGSLHVILTDVPLSDLDLAGFPESVIKTVNSGKLNALSFTIGADSKGGVEFGDTDIYDSAFKYAWSPSIKGKDKVELTTLDENRVAGRGRTEKPLTFGETGDVFDYNVSFSAPIRTWEEMQAVRSFR
jgi:hypothetical protein